MQQESKDLYAGVESSMVLNVWTRSKTVEKGTEVCLATSGGMMAKTDQDCKFSSTVLVSFPAGEPFQTISAKIIVKAVLTNQKNSRGR